MGDKSKALAVRMAMNYAGLVFLNKDLLFLQFFPSFVKCLEAFSMVYIGMIFADGFDVH